MGEVWDEFFVEQKMQDKETYFDIMYVGSLATGDGISTIRYSSMRLGIGDPSYDPNGKEPNPGSPFNSRSLT
jgi:hypothetical protein